MEKNGRITQNRITRKWIEDKIQGFIATSGLNTMEDGTGEPARDSFLVGFCSGSDPIWQQYKEYVGPFHWTPWEVFHQHCPQENADVDQLTVISWILPQRQQVRKTNGKTKKYPSEEWARIRVYGENFNVALRNHLVKSLEESGHAATLSTRQAWEHSVCVTGSSRPGANPCGRVAVTVAAAGLMDLFGSRG